MSAPDPYENRIFTGPDPVTDFFANGMLDEAFLNSSGDFVIVESSAPHEGAEIYQVMDLTTTSTPEPSSIIFLGTGILAAVGTMRRRLLQQG
jgi:hypothetical protein